MAVGVVTNPENLVQPADLRGNILTGFDEVGYTTVPSVVMDVAVRVTNTGSAALTFIGASLITLAGYDPGELAHVGVYTDADAPEGESTGWPPLNSVSSASHTTFQVVGLNGYTLRPHHVATLVYAMTPRPGTADPMSVAAGLHVSYRYRHRTGTSAVFAVGLHCVDPRGPSTQHICGSRLVHGQTQLDTIEMAAEALQRQ